MDYLEVEYAIRGRGHDEWEWAFYPKKGAGVSAARGTVKGSRDKAVAECQKAISAWRDKNPLAEG